MHKDKIGTVRLVVLMVICAMSIYATFALAQINRSANIPDFVQIRGPLNQGTIGGTLAPFPIREIGHNYAHYDTAGTFLIEEAVFGTLYGMMVGYAPNNAEIALYDTTSGQCSGTPDSSLMISTIKPANATAQCFQFNLIVGRGICVVNPANTDITVVFNQALTY